jgi:hypothetical protein
MGVAISFLHHFAQIVVDLKVLWVFVAGVSLAAWKTWRLVRDRYRWAMPTVEETEMSFYQRRRPARR